MEAMTLKMLFWLLSFIPVDQKHDWSVCLWESQEGQQVSVNASLHLKPAHGESSTISVTLQLIQSLSSYYEHGDEEQF